MDWNQRLQDIISRKKWVKNDIGKSRVQCVKLINDNNILMIIIVSDTLDHPVIARVEKVLIIDKQLVLFYDGEYCENIDKDEYARYADFLTNEEWKIIFGGDDVINMLRLNKMISEEEGFYAELHQTIEQFMERGYDKESSESLNKELHLV
ncbi:MAG: hypothetical protein Q8936_04580 [Bacillota bacterium]|nr:hypothetical protein [Bacillota bacterium]